MMKKVLSLFLSIMLLSSCAGGPSGMVSSTGELTPPESLATSYPNEYPDSGKSLPMDSSSVLAAQDPASSVEPKPTSSSVVPKPVASSSVAPKPVTSSSVAPKPAASSSVVPKPVAFSVAASKPTTANEETASFSSVETPMEEEAAPTFAKSKAVPNEVAAVWISYLEFLTIAKGQSRAGFTQNIDNLFANSANYGLNTVFVQVRPFGDAMYNSKYFPYSYVMTGKEGVDPGYDPLEIMVEKAKEHGLRIEAWINPYRVRTPGSPYEISASNPVVNFIKSGSDAVIRYNGGTYYNPSSKTARKLIADGVVEIIQNYDIDGIHFDDYFYPTTDAAFDATYYNAYKNAGGKHDLGDWRRENVNTMVREVYAAVKNANPYVIFGISPQARVEINYGSQYADVEKWLSSKEYVDYICPQIYFGFDHEVAPYLTTLDTWNKMASRSGVELYVGLAAYKSGIADNGAKSGKNEWINSDTMLRDMVAESRKRSTYAGFVIYRYDSLFKPEPAVKAHIARERDNLAELLGQ